MIFIDSSLYAVKSHSYISIPELVDNHCVFLTDCVLYLLL